jgi:precorrin-6Y C5,15-methyltransferase (decarboxylating)
MNQRIPVVGMGSDGLAGLSALEKDALAIADCILAPSNSLALLDSLSAEKVPLGTDLNLTHGLIQDRLGKSQKLVIVVSGDPLFYGLAGWLCEKFGKDRFEILPHVSSMQLAFARIKERWEDAYLGNLQTLPVERLLDLARTLGTLGLFTTPEVGPDVVARLLLERGLHGFNAYVCENLGTPRERITQGSLAEIASLKFDPLNILILLRDPSFPPQAPTQRSGARFGNPDAEYAEDAPARRAVTPAEVRSIALGYLRLKPGIVMWDVGAGSGSVAIEVANLIETGQVFAIEEDPVDLQRLASNLRRYNATMVKPVFGSAPKAFQGLPSPEAVFIGGIGIDVPRMLEPIWNAMKPGGVLVIHLASPEAFVAVNNDLRARTEDVSVLHLQLAMGIRQMASTLLDPLPPSYMLRACKV